MVKFYKDYPKNSEVLTLNTAQVSCSGGKDVIVRNIAQADSVVEYWDRRNYTFTITGLIYLQRSFPNFGRFEDPLDKSKEAVGLTPSVKTLNVYEEVQAMNNIFNHEGALGVKHAMINKLGVETVIITDFQLPFTQGRSNQNYVITCISDYVKSS